MSKIKVEGGWVGVGDYVCFKWDVEQCARVVGIRGIWVTVEAGSNGFDGDYCGSATRTTVAADQCWVE